MNILPNLLNNGNKFTSDGMLVVRTKLVEETEVSQRVRFEVQDSGIGISPVDQIKLFQPCVQAEEGSASQYGGIGLGLWICSSFVELMKGQFGVVSEQGREGDIDNKYERTVAFDSPIGLDDYCGYYIWSDGDIHEYPVFVHLFDHPVGSIPFPYRDNRIGQFISWHFCQLLWRLHFRPDRTA
ncbi:response regulator receiver:ATP-binding region, ATPase-like:histidine kinase, hamp region:histidine [Paenibacillus terrae HPL-003]|uniref:histidine kinase n=1 Tax=Paenibacillus terrae (strain HPL-003) TaxID=985665 RepID=G7VZG2_PAETH|nr:response regulator receiver:ATP-binding region, ATPase-like:histidine kinase, hamp region:histidine [Paenibacillus terrae HPL-003]